MKSTRVMILVTMMLVMVMGSLTEAQTPPPPSRLQKFESCMIPCVPVCTNTQKQSTPACVFQCLKHCLAVTLFPPPSPPSSTSQITVANEIDLTDSYCTLGCVTHHDCASLSKFEYPNLKKSVSCVESCSNKCSIKN